MKKEFIHTLGLALCFLLLCYFFNILYYRINITIDNNNTRHNDLIERIDSLENELNTFYKNKRDTIIINVVPADVKIYPKIYNN